jgi:hypothetical protein
MVTVNLPGEIWEVEFFDDQEPAIEIYRSTDGLYGGEIGYALGNHQGGLKVCLRP